MPSNPSKARMAKGTAKKDGRTVAKKDGRSGSVSSGSSGGSAKKVARVAPVAPVAQVSQPPQVISEEAVKLSKFLKRRIAAVGSFVSPRLSDKAIAWALSVKRVPSCFRRGWS